MNIVVLVLLLAAALLFAFAAANTPARINLIAAGLLAWVITLIIKAVEAIH